MKENKLISVNPEYNHVSMVIFGIYGYKGVAYNMPPKKESQKADADHSTTHDNERTDEVPAT